MAKANLGDLGENFGNNVEPASPVKRSAPLATPVTPEGYTAEYNVEDLVSSDSMSFDHINQLAPFLAIAERVTEAAHPSVAPSILGKLSTGFRKAGEYLAIAKYQYASARNERKRQEAIAFIDEFPKWLKQKQADGNDIKATDAIRTHFVAQYGAVIKAKEREAFYEAVQEQLITMKTELFMGISTAKAIAYGFKDQNMLSSAATSGHAGEEKD